MNNKELKQYYRQETSGMNKGEILLEYIKKNPNKRKYELVNELVHITSKEEIDKFIRDNPDSKKVKNYKNGVTKSIKNLMSYSTLNENLKTLKNIGQVLYNKTTKTYSINPNYIESIKDKKSIIIDLIDQLEITKQNKELSFLNNYKVVIRSLIGIFTEIEINQNKDSKEFYFSNPYFEIIKNLVRAIILDCILYNPEIWGSIEKPEDLDFTINIKTNWSKDKRIYDYFNIIKEYALKHKEIGSDFRNQFSLTIRSFLGEKEYIGNEKQARFDKEIEDLIRDIHNSKLTIQEFNVFKQKLKQFRQFSTTPYYLVENKYYTTNNIKFKYDLETYKAKAFYEQTNREKEDNQERIDSTLEWVNDTIKIYEDQAIPSHEKDIKEKENKINQLKKSLK